MKIKRHFIKANLYSKGYCLLVSENEIISINDINFLTNNIPHEYLLIENRIEEILFSAKVPINVSFIHNKSNNTSFVGFGIFLDILDDKRRKGISFIHCIEIWGSDDIYNVVLQFLKILTPNNITDFYIPVLQGLAISNIDIFLTYSKLVNFISVYRFNSDNPNVKDNQSSFYSKIIHDCIGAAPLVWLTYASFLSTNAYDAQVFDSIDKNGIISTTISPVLATRIINASELVFFNKQGSNCDDSRRKKEDIGGSIAKYPYCSTINPATFTSAFPSFQLKRINREIKKSINSARILLLLFLIVSIVSSSFLSYYMNRYELFLIQVNSKKLVADCTAQFQRFDHVKTTNFENQLVKSSQKSDNDSKQFISLVLRAIGSSGDKLTLKEIENFKSNYPFFDSMFDHKVSFIIQNFTKFDVNSDNKLDFGELNSLFS